MAYTHSVSLVISPPQQANSLWQTICQNHGVLVHAVRKPMAVLTGRLHEYNELERCTVHIGGLRCMFCFSLIEICRWRSNVAISCDPCLQKVHTGRGATYRPLPLEWTGPKIPPTV